MTALNMNECTCADVVKGGPDIPENNWRDDYCPCGELRPTLNGAELIDDMRHIKEEMGAMMLEIKNTSRSDIKVVIGKEMDHNCAQLMTAVL